MSASPRKRTKAGASLDLLHADIGTSHIQDGIGYFMAGALGLPGIFIRISAGIAALSFWKVGSTWGAAITTAPYATRAAAVARGAMRPQGSVFSANTMSVITAMAAIFMMPSGNRMTNRS